MVFPFTSSLGTSLPLSPLCPHCLHPFQWFWAEQLLNNSIDQWWTVLVDQILGKKSGDLFSNPFHSISYWLIDTDLRSVTNSLWCDCYEPSRVVGIVMTVPSRDAIAPFCDVIVMRTSSTCHDCHCYGTAAALFWPTIDTEKHPNMVAAITIVAIDAIIGIVLLLLCQPAILNWSATTAPLSCKSIPNVGFKKDISVFHSAAKCTRFLDIRHCIVKQAQMVL